MTRILGILAACAALVTGFGGVSPLAAQERGYVVIVNAANDLASVSAEELSQLFMKRTSQWGNGQAVTPVDLPERSMIRANFSQDVHHKTTAEVKSYWQTVIFSGRGVPPVEAASEDAAIAFVRANPGAVAYVFANRPLGEGVRAVRIRS